MTEAEWLSCAYPKTMMTFMWAKITERKVRLFAAACCSRSGQWVTDQRSREALKVAEAYADGRATDAELWQAHEAAGEAYNASCDAALYLSDASYRTGQGIPTTPQEQAAFAAFAAVYHEAGAGNYDCDLGLGEIDLYTAAFRASSYAAGAVCANRSSNDALEAEFASHAALLRDVCGNPFRPAIISPTWFTTTVVGMAKAIYDDRSFGRLPILGDALEEAGCTNEAVLAHCRGPGPHVRGCWVVDLLLGKE